jgi:hypothetical protein
MVDGHVDDHKRLFVNPPPTYTNDTVIDFALYLQQQTQLCFVDR